jgi:hypothetical protein
METNIMQHQSPGLRRHERLLQTAAVEIIWTDSSGNDRFQRAHAFDISESGMQIDLMERLEERIYVTLRAEHLAVHGTASVRSCVRKGIKYRVGLEFSAGLKWKTIEKSRPHREDVGERLDEIKQEAR